LQFILERKKLDEPTTRKLFGQLCDAIRYCHEKSVIHRDIKHKNILMTEGGDCKLIDFGLSNFMTGQLRSTFCGTPAYGEVHVCMQY
jgi:serine/threonine protein kinase